MMNIACLTFNPVQVNTYVIWDETLECVIIDPGCSNSSEEQQLVDFIENKGLSPVRLLNTHGHFDHIWGNNFVSKKWNLDIEAHAFSQEIMDKGPSQGAMFGIDVPEAAPISKEIQEGDKIHFGNSTLDTLHVPGHEPGSIVFYSASDHFMVCGDVLFNGSIGRTDLYKGDYEQLIRGIKTKVIILPDETIIYSGHGVSTSIENEKRNNPFLQ
ncbi:MBL fold metallo-hydrolase [Halosquirtibacter laminarini]|uniref:MBL fold metallo-hydrolase n=1 Tax=Halosquirtibacter laminarini TaxID=3374600 RepID=A0AC61NM85_9BACT|nr:MBL fold metallo-hydrolase [Prolixibacteraceae bacterium]